MLNLASILVARGQQLGVRVQILTTAIAQQHPGVDPPTRHPTGLPKSTHELLPIFFIAENRFPPNLSVKICTLTPILPFRRFVPCGQSVGEN